MVKVCGTGNDFLIVDSLKNPDLSLPSPKEIQSFCHRQNGFGADGFVYLKPHADLDFEWVFFNSDGSQAEMCGNAARAVSRYFAYANKKSSFAFLTYVGVIKAQVEHPQEISGNVTVEIPKWSEYSEGHSSPAGNYTFVNSGVPHAVLDSKDLSDLTRLKEKALIIKALKPFQERGVNVTFKSPSREKNKIHSVTFERGVENFTLSCGTGAIAAAIAESGGSTEFKWLVQVPGGVLTVLSNSSGVFLSGEGRIVGSCHLGAIE